jgi:hypothetical protein
MMRHVRTTVTIDDDLLAQARLIAAREHRTIGSVLEEALRRLLAEQRGAPERSSYPLPRFNLGNPGLRPGVDLTDKEQLAELLGDSRPPGVRT